MTVEEIAALGDPLAEHLFADVESLRRWLADVVRSAPPGIPAHVRAVAVHWLGSRDNVAWLTELLDDPNPEVRLAAALYLSGFAPETSGVRACLLGWLTQDEMPERLRSEPDYSPDSRKYRAPVWFWPTLAGLRRLPFPGSAITRADEDYIVGHALGMPDPAETAELVRALAHEDRVVRRTAALALAYTPDQFGPWLPQLQEAARNADLYVQQMSMLATERNRLGWIEELDGAWTLKIEPQSE